MDSRLFFQFCETTDDNNLSQVKFYKDAVDKRIDAGNKDKGDECRNGETENDGSSERTEHSRTFTAHEHHRDHAENCGHRGHENRSQTFASGVDQSIVRRERVTLLYLLHVVDKNDRVVDDDTDKNDHSEECGHRKRFAHYEKTEENA